MRSTILRLSVLGTTLGTCAAIAAGCSSNGDGGTNNTVVGTGGVFGTGGVLPPATGGMMMVGSGGAPAGTGGVPVGTGGVPAGTGGVVGTGGIVGTGGMPNTGGMVSVGGMSNANDIKIVGSTTLCMGAMPMLPMTQVSACMAMNCTGAHCIPQAQIPMGTDTSTLATCPDGSFCTPDDYTATQGKFLVKKCVSLEMAEGRCISTCVPQVAKQIDQLPKDVCADSERCAPCWNPIDGTDTKACTQGCDTGNPMTKVTFAPCGKDPMDMSAMPKMKGLCVPKTLVPMDLQGIPADTCAADHLCAPIEKVKDLKYNFPTCTPSGLAGAFGMKNMAGQAGGCVPPYLVGSQASSLMADGCANGDLCAPCTNPLSTPTANAPTGACPWP